MRRRVRPMKERPDAWYIRLPDGRIVKAKSTLSVQHHIESGNIPLNSLARRASEEEWVTVSWVKEISVKKTEREPEATAFGSASDLDVKSEISTRLDPMRLQTVGIRGLVDELIAAFESLIVGGKLLFACVISMLAAAALFLVVRSLFSIWPEGIWLARTVSGSLALLGLAFITTRLTRQTHLELSRMKPVSAAEASRGLGPYVLRVFLGYVATLGAGVGLILLFQHVPGWLFKAAIGWNVTLIEILMTTTWVISLIFSVGFCLVMILSSLVPAILIVEECSVGDALREWRALLNDNRVRVLVYEGLALALSIVAALPLALPVELAMHYGTSAPFGVINWFTLAIPFVLQALAIAPALGFLAIANLFIYLNLRYEQTAGK